MAGPNLEYLRAVIAGGENAASESRLRYPPPISRTLGLVLVAIGEGTATLAMTTNTETQANPMGTIHGGLLGDLADAAMGTAHVTTLEEGESLTTVDFQIHFFRPVWNDTLTAVARPVHLGRTVCRYVCDVTRADGRLIAQATSTVMTLRGDAAGGR